MFYFLLFTGTAMILLGMRGMKKKRKRDRRRVFSLPESDVIPDEIAQKEEDQEMIKDLSDRMAEMEKSLFEHLLKWQMEKEELLEQIRTEKTSYVESITENQVEKKDREDQEEAVAMENRKKPMPDHIRKVMDYEDEGLSIQEIANVTQMNKGEVLLLRNLAKHYRK